ncbi:extracellular solute-binding protein [Pararhizobium sp. LjRoot255]|uniref:extracellular solute-binding protein n=1 Tax=Pararhizobium sp. LjRoot255 TaxID=3342298 RepID=UPI003ECE097C
MLKSSWLAIAAFALSAYSALAAGELHIYNWGEYTNSKLIEKFEKAYNVKITLDFYDSNETMMSKVRAGGSAFDIVVPSDYAVAIMIDTGMLEKTEPAAMANFKNMDPAIVDIYFDKGRHYSVPWQLGLTSFVVDTAVYKGDINSYSILFDPPAELKGRINMLDDMTAIMHAAERYLGFPRCTSDKMQLKAVNELLNKAKPSWRTFSYDSLQLLAAKDVDAAMIWNGAAFRARAQRNSLVFAYPKEGIEGFMDNVVVLKGAANLQNAKLFQNFIMDPENAALISDFAKYNNGIVGSEKYLSQDFSDAPEIKRPDGATPEYVAPCSSEVVTMYNKIWTNLRK